MNPLNSERCFPRYDANICAVALSPLTVRFPSEKVVKASMETEKTLK